MSLVRADFSDEDLAIKNGVHALPRPLRLGTDRSNLILLVTIMSLIPATNRGGIAIIVVNAVVGFIAIAVVSLRLWARKIKNARIDGSDWTCVLGLVGDFLDVGAQLATDYCSYLLSDCSRLSSMVGHTPRFFIP